MGSDTGYEQLKDQQEYFFSILSNTYEDKLSHQFKHQITLSVEFYGEGTEGKFEKKIQWKILEGLLRQDPQERIAFFKLLVQDLQEKKGKYFPKEFYTSLQNGNYIISDSFGDYVTSTKDAFYREPVEQEPETS